MFLLVHQFQYQPRTDNVRKYSLHRLLRLRRIVLGQRSAHGGDDLRPHQHLGPDPLFLDGQRELAHEVGHDAADGERGQALRRDLERARPVRIGAHFYDGRLGHSVPYNQVMDEDDWLLCEDMRCPHVFKCDGVCPPQPDLRPIHFFVLADEEQHYLGTLGRKPQ